MGAEQNDIPQAQGIPQELMGLFSFSSQFIMQGDAYRGMSALPEVARWKQTGRLGKRVYLFLKDVVKGYEDSSTNLATDLDQFVIEYLQRGDYKFDREGPFTTDSFVALIVAASIYRDLLKINGEFASKRLDYQTRRIIEEDIIGITSISKGKLLDAVHRYPQDTFLTPDAISEIRNIDMRYRQHPFNKPQPLNEMASWLGQRIHF